MRLPRRMYIGLLCNYTACFLWFSSPGAATAQDVYLCVWRNPERTMTKIFPDAKDYATVNLKIPSNQQQAIEKELGFELLAGQRDKFQYFRMSGENGNQIGTIIAASQKGEFGAIEFVFGLDTSHTINGLYVQRSRERDQSFKERAFLDLFVGKSIEEVRSLDSVWKGASNHGINAIIRGLSKELVAFRILVLDK